MTGVFDYTSKELSKRVDEYFNECEEQGKRPTVPGLCLKIGITTRQWDGLMAVYHGEEQTLKRANRLQMRHMAVLEKALTRIIDALENETSAMAMFRLKQPRYAGYTDKPAGDTSGSVNVSINLKGLKVSELGE